MKVIHLIGGGDVGGAKTHVLSLVKELSRYLDVKIISLRSGGFSDDARKMGIDIEVVKSGNFFSDINKVIAIIKEGGYDLIHSHGAKANLFAVIASRYAKLPTITTVHSDYKLDYLQSPKRMYSYGLINTIALRFIDYYTAVSGNFKKMLISRNFKEDRIFTVYNGIDFTKPIPQYSRRDFIRKYKLDMTDGDVAVGILCRFDPVKGLDSFIKAAKEVLSENPDVKFILGGDGAEKGNLENLARSLGIQANVLFPGWIDDPLEFMSCLDINVLTSLSESFPYVILEGTLYKKCTVSSDVGGISDLIKNGDTGYLFPPGDYKILAEYLKTLVKNPALREVLGQNLYQKASTEFSLQNMCKTQLDIYKNILNRNGGQV